MPGPPVALCRQPDCVSSGKRDISLRCDRLLADAIAKELNGAIFATVPNALRLRGQAANGAQRTLLAGMHCLDDSG